MRKLCDYSNGGGTLSGIKPITGFERYSAKILPRMTSNHPRVDFVLDADHSETTELTSARAAPTPLSPPAEIFRIHRRADPSCLVTRSPPLLLVLAARPPPPKHTHTRWCFSCRRWVWSGRGVSSFRTRSRRFSSSTRSSLPALPHLHPGFPAQWRSERAHDRIPQVCCSVLSRGASRR